MRYFLIHTSDDYRRDWLDKEEKTAWKGISASNFVSKSGHAAAMYNLQVCGTIDLQHCVACGQSEINNAANQ